MIAVYFLGLFLLVILGIHIRNKITKKPISETVLATFSTTLVTLLTRLMAGDAKGYVDVDFYFIKVHDFFISSGEIGLSYYYGFTGAFLATFLSYGGYMYDSKQRNLKS